MLDKPKIIWEKWLDPYGFDEYNIDYENDNSIDTDIEYAQKPNKVLATTMGIIPYNEKTDCCKIFNFWIGHTNFNLSNKIASIISEINGVEVLDIFTRYRFRAAFGKAFIDRDVMNEINTTINKII
jgi:hypothetical protein